MLSVTDPRLFAPGQEAHAASFARRLLRFPQVRSVEIDPVRTTAAVRYRVSPADQEAFIGHLADALVSDDIPEFETMPNWRSGETVRLRRYGDLITILEILTHRKDCLEVRHRALVQDSMTGRRVTDALRQIPGLLEATIEAGKLTMRLDPTITSAAELVRRTETELLVPPDPHAAPRPERVDFGMAKVSLGVSTAGELLPAVKPVAAGLLVANSLDTAAAAVRQLSAGKIGLPLLYTSIAALTLVSGQFLTAAVMLWFFRSWEQRYRRDLEIENQAMLDEIVGVPSEALAVSADGMEQIVPRPEIGAGRRLRVRTGERIPADGTVIDGAALVDEVRLLGEPTPAIRIKGDEVLAGSRLLAGQLDLTASRIGEQTRAAQVSRALLATTVAAPAEWTLNPLAENFADRTVGPTMVAAGLGLLIGGPAMSVAILRPDYATGMGLAVPLETLRSVRIALRHGALICSDNALSRLASSSWVVLDDHQALERGDCELAEIQVRGIEEDRLLPALAAAGIWLGDPRGPALIRACRARRLIARRASLLEIGATFVAIEYGGRVLRLSGKADRARFAPLRVELDGVEVARLRFQRTVGLAAAASVRRLQRAGLRVLLTSERGASAVASLARRLDVDLFLSETDAGSCRRLLRELSGRGVKAVHVQASPVLADPDLQDSSDTHLSVALAGADETFLYDADHNPDIALLGQSIAPLPALAELAHDSMARIASLRRFAVMPNLACVAGAFAFGVPSLAVVFLSNLGTSMVYNRARRALHLASLDDTSPPEAAWCAEDDALADTNH